MQTTNPPDTPVPPHSEYDQTAAESPPASRCPLSRSDAGRSSTRRRVSTLSRGDQALVAVYVALALVGAAVTWYFNLTFEPADGSGYLQAWFANSAASSAAADLIVVAVVGALWMIVEARRVSIRFVWLHVLAIPFIAIAFSFPLFLARRHVVVAGGRS